MKAGHVLLFSNKEGGGKKKKDEKKARDLKKQNYFSNRIGEKKKNLKTLTCLITAENKHCANVWACEWRAGCFE